MKCLTTLMTAVLLAGCNSPELQGDSAPTISRGEPIGTAGVTRIYVFHDNENHNTCYVTERGMNVDGSTAISCVPMVYRNLHQESSDAVSYR